MELGDLKDAWTQYDKKLTENLKLNEELFKKINFNNCKKEIQKPLYYEIFSVVFYFLILTFFVGASIRFISEPKLFIPGFISAFICLLFLIITIIKINRFLTIDYYGSSVLKLQKDIAALNKLLIRFRKYELISVPIVVVLFMPLLNKIFNNIDVYEHVKLYIIEIIFIIVLTYPATFWIYRNLYDNKFKNAEKLLSELNKFEKEE
ncbi:MAG: hypothetical protein ABI315_01325 [Bacteroidia bacterium]